MENILLVIVPGSEELEKAQKGLSTPSTNSGGPIPTVPSHSERIKFTQMVVQRMKEQAGTVDHKGRKEGENPPYASFKTGVSGEGSSATGTYGKVSILKPSEIGASGSESVLSVGTIKQPLRKN